jgi:hypothetical protein
MFINRYLKSYEERRKEKNQIDFLQE